MLRDSTVCLVCYTGKDFNNDLKHLLDGNMEGTGAVI